ncbi:37615_t:CDS:2, partial [Gigaspora margarita]
PKNTENLRDAQRKLNYQKVYEVLLDVHTRWNSMYLAWKRLLELKNAILYLITILKISSEKDDKDDADYLGQINLTELEWILFSDMLTVLAPFYEATKMLSGVSYTMLNMVCCTMHYLKKTVALPNDQDEDYYAELLYEELDVTASQNDEIVDLAGRVNQALSISQGRIQKHKNTPVNSQQNSNSKFKKRQAIEPPVTITNMLKQVKATIYLSMCQYWDIPKEITLISVLLDPRYKKLKFVTETQHDIVVDKLNELY